MRTVISHDYDLTDYDALKTFALEFAQGQTAATRIRAIAPDAKTIIPVCILRAGKTSNC